MEMSQTPKIKATPGLLRAMGVNLDAPLFLCRRRGVKMTPRVCLIYQEQAADGCARCRGLDK
jgi:phosphoribosyl-dephospho-CoA transferase